MAERKEIMLAKMFTPKLFKQMGEMGYTQPKIEGDRARAVFDNHGRVKLYSSSAKVIRSVPHINKELEEYGGRNMELDGELYRHGVAHRDIRSIVSRTKNLHPNYKVMQYHIFDMVTNDIQYKRLKNLIDWFVPMKYVRRVEGKNITGITSFQKEYERYINKGYEGIILRDLKSRYIRRKTGSLLKLKPRVSETFKYVDMEEEQDKYGVLKNTMGNIRLLTEDGVLFKVGTGFTKRQRKLFWNNSELMPSEIKIRFQSYTKANNVPKMSSIDKHQAKEIENKIFKSV